LPYTTLFRSTAEEAPRAERPAAASVPKGTDGITLATIAPARTLGKCHSENCRVLCDGPDGRGTLLATASRAAPVETVERLFPGVSGGGCSVRRSRMAPPGCKDLSWRWSVSEPRSAPTVGQVVLGRRLLDLRERAGLKREEAARILRVAPATVRRMEMAEVALKIPYLQLLLKAYGVSDEEADAFVQLAEEANKPGWW